MTPLVLLVTSAFLHALWNALLKKANRAYDSSQNVFGTLVVATSMATFFCLGLGLLREVTWTASLTFSIVGAGICEGGYVIFLGRAMERLPYSMAYTLMRGLAMILVWTISTLVLRESFVLQTALGVAIVLLGLVWVGGGFRSFLKFKTKFLPTYFCAVFIAGYHLCYGEALKQGVPELVLFSAALWIALILMATLDRRLRGQMSAEILVRRWRFFIGTGILCAASFVIFLKGLSESAAGYAFTIRNSSVLFAQILGLFLGERAGLWAWLGALAVFLGALLLPHA